jgi:predicted transcriptional regulator
MLVRFDDETAREVRERARKDGKSITAFLNDAVRSYLDQKTAFEGADDARRIRFAVRLADAMDELHRTADPRENNSRELLAAIVDCLELLPVHGETIDDPVTWEQYKYSKLNPAGSESEARRMFERDYSEVEARPWTWYRKNHESDDLAKIAWLRQRRRYGVPVSPEEVGG